MIEWQRWLTDQGFGIAHPALTSIMWSDKLVIFGRWVMQMGARGASSGIVCLRHAVVGCCVVRRPARPQFSKRHS
eukprot:2158087-Prymnesium_polylepis.1